MTRRVSERMDDERFRDTEDAAIASLIYVDPDPRAVARLAASHDWEACLARWHWIGARKLGAIARTGRTMLGLSSGSTRTRATSIAEEAALIETAYAISNIYAAEIAARASRNTLQVVFDAWGIPRSDRPKTSGSDRSRFTIIGRGLSQGEAWAIEADAVRRAHDRAVYEVVCAALAMLPEPKPDGRPPLPEPSDALRAAVQHLPAAAVEAVFPGLVQNEPKESVMSSTASTATASQFGRCPDDETLQARLAAGISVAAIATEFGVSASAIYQKRKALGVVAPAQPIEAAAAPAQPASAPAAPDPQPVQTLVSVQPRQAVVVSNPMPLAVEALLRAREVMLACGCHPMEAVGLVRADMAHVRLESQHA